MFEKYVTEETLEDVSPEKISFAFDSFPSYLFIRFQGFDEFIVRFFETAAFYLPEYSNQLLCSLLATKWDSVVNKSNFPREKLSKILRSEARAVIAKAPNSKALWATFAEKLATFGDKEQPQKIAVSWINGKVVWKIDFPDRIALLRMAVCYILSTDKTKWSRVLGQLFVKGEINDDGDRNPRAVEKEYNRLLAEALERNFANWEGSEVDLISSLILLYNSRRSDGSTHIKRITTVHENITRNVRNQKFPVFMKLYIELLQEHLNSNKNLSPKILHAELKRLVEEFPRNINFMRSLIDALCLGKGVYALRKILESPSDDLVVEIYRAFGLVYLELSRYRLQTICFEAQCHSVEKLCSTLESVSNRLNHRYDIFWRLLLFIRNERNEVERCREAFYLSQSVCPWSKALILDYAKTDPDIYITLITLMEEKCLRVHCQKEEVPLLTVG